MSGLWIAVIIVASVVAWLAMWATSVRFADQIGDQDSLAREDRREMAFSIGAAAAPLMFIVIGAWWIAYKTGILGWLRDFTHPVDVRKKRNADERERLFAEAARYRDLSYETHGTERDVLRAAADACEREANALR